MWGRGERHKRLWGERDVLEVDRIIDREIRNKVEDDYDDYCALEPKV